MIYPEELRTLVAGIVARHAETGPAIAEATEAVRAMENFEEIQCLLINGAVERLVHEFRHARTRATKQAARQYGPPAQVRPVAGPAVRRACQAFLDDYKIAGTVVGNLRGGRALLDAAAVEQARGIGNFVNAEFCRWLHGEVPEGQTVRQVFGRRAGELLHQFETIRQRVLGENGAA